MHISLGNQDSAMDRDGCITFGQDVVLVGSGKSMAWLVFCVRIQGHLQASNQWRGVVSTSWLDVKCSLKVELPIEWHTPLSGEHFQADMLLNATAANSISSNDAEHAGARAGTYMLQTAPCNTVAEPHYAQSQYL
jgi:hypothetical protein